MANNPKKSVDPTQAALSAIQEALKVGNEQQAEEDTAVSDGGSDRPSPDLWHDAVPAPASAVAFDSEPIGARGANKRAFPANDDQQSIGQVLQALQSRPARTSYFVAAIFSAAWIVGCLALSWAYLSHINAALGPGHSPSAVLIGLGAAALLPIIFFFGLAHMAWRAQELRLVAQSMAKVAVRLAEPESVARDSIVTVGQAIRREVAAMGDGVERALARASELETLVRNEVAALERTYSDNEVRIRGLLQDLTNQRDTLVGQAEQVRSAINNVHIDLTQDLSTISDIVGQQVNDAAERITQSLAEKGEHITLTLGQIGDGMIQQLNVRGEDLIVRLENASAETSRALATASDQLVSSLNFKTDHIGEDFSEIARGLESMMTSRLDGVTDGFSEKSLAIVDMMVGRSQELTDAIVNTSSQLAETLATRAEEVNSTLKASGESLILDLNLRGGEVAKKLEAAGAKVTDTLVARTDTLTETLVARTDTLTETLIGRTDKVADAMQGSADQLAETVKVRGEETKQMLATRLAAFEKLFDKSGAELGERISRDSSTLGNLITRHLAEFDRTVKTYGSELVERLGARTQDFSESMRSYVDNFDQHVTARATEVTTGLDHRLANFQQTIDGRTQTLTEALGTRLLDIAKTLSEGGRDVVAAVDKRVSVVNTTLDGHLGQMEQLLVGRTEAVTQQIEVRSRAAASLLSGRLEELSESIKLNSSAAEQAITQLTDRSVDALGKSTAASVAATEALNRGAAHATASLSHSAAEAAASLNQSATEVTTSLNRSAGEVAASLNRSAGEAAASLNRSAGEATAVLNRSASALSNTIAKSATAAAEAIGKTSATAAEAMENTSATATAFVEKSSATMTAVVEKSSATLTAAVEKTSANVTAVVDRTSATVTEAIGKTSAAAADAIGRSASEAERTLLGAGAEVARNITGRADEITSTVSQRVNDMTRLLDEKSNGFLVALSSKGQEFSGEVSRVTDQAVKSIEAKSFVFTQTMMDNSEEIARLINDASQAATVAMTRTLGQVQEGVHGASEMAKQSLTRTLDDLHSATKAAVEESKQTASATVADMLETHSMLRSDTTTLFERLREANILLQEVLSGAHENMTSLERTMVTRVSGFVAAMNDLSAKSDTSASLVERHLGTFNTLTGKTLRELGEIAAQFTMQGRSLAEAVEHLEKSNNRAEETIASRKAGLEALVSTLDTRADDFGQRLQRFSTLLDESLDTATARAREIAGVVAETSNESVRSIEQQFEVVRAISEEERKRTNETLNAAYEETGTQVTTAFHQSVERFGEIMQGLKQMATEMQRELEATRAELRRGIFELPQETADSAAQMRRVIVDQIEALAELNRIVARHGHSLEAVEPIRREPEPAHVGGTRTPARPSRSDITAAPPPAARADITGAPTRRPEQASLGAQQNGGWLSDLLSRASRDESPPIAPTPRNGGRPERRPQREGIDSLDSLAVDVARMIDNDAAAEVWERYKRGERGVFTKRLYTAPGQKAFDEIRRKYRGDPEFRQTVEHYIHEFERLLEEVSRGDRGATVARNYLTSDTGKVYTLLAHAAGRFDQ